MKKMMMSDLPEDLVVEILFRVPITSLRSIRSTCKKWNVLSRNWIFGKLAEAKNPFLGFMTNNLMICSVRMDLQGINNDGDVDLSIKHVRKEFQVYNAYHCDGLLLCILHSNLSLVVWNPYLGQTRLVQPIFVANEAKSLGSFALGYSNNRNHKILHILDSRYQEKHNGFNIYEFRSDSWRVLDLTPNVKIHISHNVTLKGNAYFYAQEKEKKHIKKHWLLCFDFTSERFGPRLSLPYDEYCGGNTVLSCVRDKQLAVLLCQPWREEIWVTNKIDYNEVLWTKWLQVHIYFPNLGGFFIDEVEEKKVAVVFNHVRKNQRCINQIAHIIGQDEYLKSINLGEYELSIRPELFGYCPGLVNIQ